MTSVSASRVMRSSAGPRLAMMLVAGAIAVLGALGAPSAQETPVPAPPAAAPESTPAATPPATDAGPDSTEDAQAPASSRAQPAGEKAAPAGAATRQPKERFEPTEKVRADFDVSFPVDI
jgi:hypothetical protein